MPVNLGLAQLSNNFLICTVVLYSLALLAYAGDFAFGRHPSTTVIPAAEEPELVAAGVSAAGVPAAADRAGPGSAEGGPAPGVPGPGERSRLSWVPAGPWVRVALVLNALGLAVHLTGV